MEDHIINIFISHSWSYSGHYDKLAEWIFDEEWKVGQRKLLFRDYSVPRSDPIHNASNTAGLEKAIYAQVRQASVVVIPMGMYSSHSKWIKFEIEAAKTLNKPILAVNPWGQQRKASVVATNANKEVG